VICLKESRLLLARLMGLYCFARWRLSSVVCRLSSSVTLLAGGRAGRRARRRSASRHCTAGQYGYVPLSYTLFDSIFTVRRYGSAVCCRRVSVRLSVRPSVRHKPHVLSKRLKVESRKQRRTIAHGLWFSDTRDLGEIPTGSHLTVSRIEV